MNIAEIVTLLQDEISEIEAPSILENCSPGTLEIRKDDLMKIMDFLHTDPRLYFDVLTNLTAIDNGTETGTMEIIYHLNSIPKSLQLAVKVSLDRTTPEVDSVCEIWRTANWQEREAFDLVGVRFTGHPDLRRILLPNDWEGHPLQKDYSEQAYYHGIKVKY